MKNRIKKLVKIFAVLLMVAGTCFSNTSIFANNHMATLRFQSGNIENKLVTIEMRSTKSVEPEIIEISDKDANGDFIYTMEIEEGVQYSLAQIKVDKQNIDMTSYAADFTLLNDTLTLLKENTNVKINGNEIFFQLQKNTEADKEIQQSAPKSKKQAFVEPAARSIPDDLESFIDANRPDFTQLDWKDATLDDGNIFGSATDICVFTFNDFIINKGVEIIGKASIGGNLDNGSGNPKMVQMGQTMSDGNGYPISWSTKNINFIIGNDLIGDFSKGGIHGWLASAIRTSGLENTELSLTDNSGNALNARKNTYIYGDYQIDEKTKVSDKISKYFADAKTNLTKKANDYMTNPLGTKGTVEHYPYQTTLTGTDNDFNVFDLTSAQFNEMSALKIDVPLNSYIQINITDSGDLNFKADITQSNVLSGNIDTRIDALGVTGEVENLSACSHIFWNMPETETLTTDEGGLVIPGSILGPKVNLTLNGVSTNGSIIVNSYTMNNTGGEAHNYPFKYKKNTPDKTGKVEITGTKVFEGKEWDAESFTIEMQDDKGNVLDSKIVNKENKNFTFEKAYTDRDISETPYHYVIKENATKINSIINADNTYDIYVKVSDGTENALKIETSRDGATYSESNSVALGNAAFTNTYFKGSVEISKTLDGAAFSGNSEAAFSLYSYTSETASLNDAGNKKIKDVTTTEGKVSISDLEEGKYFLVETSAPDGYVLDKTLHTFEVNATNYKTPNKISVDNKAELKTALKFSGTKVLNGRAIKDTDEFKVELVGAGLAMQTVNINTDGTFEIAIDQLKVGEYNYTIREQQPASRAVVKGIDYDTKEYALKIIVSETDGKLSSEVSIDGKSAAVNDGVVVLSEGATFANTYTANGSVSINGSKAMTSGEWKADEVFDIQIKDDKGNIETQTVSKDVPTFSFIKNYTQEDLGKTYHYVISEQQKAINSMIFDTSEHDVYIRISEAADGSLKIETSRDGTTYSESNSVALGNAAFTNTYFKGSVEISKTLDGAAFSGNSEAAFSLYSYTSETASLNDAGNKKIKDVTTTEGKVSISDLEEGKYFLVETSAPDGYVLDKTLHTFEVNATNYKTPNKISVDNLTQPKMALNFKGTKALEGRNIAVSDDFKVELLDESNAVIKTAKIGMDGSFEISTDQVKAGEYNYIIREKQPASGKVEKGTTYDTTTYKLNVKISETDGKLSSEVNIDGKSAVVNDGVVVLSEGATFTNTYVASGSLKISGTKVFTGREWNDDETFNIVISDDKGNSETQTVRNDAPTFNFERTYTQEDAGKEFHYVVSEQQDSINSVIFDTTKYDVYVKVSDQKDGTLKIETSMNGTTYTTSTQINLGNAAFTNTYFKGSVEVIKTLDGAAFSGDSEAVFNLYSYTGESAVMGAEGNKKIGGDYTTTNGVLSIPNLEEGKYFLYETQAPKDYIKSNDVYAFAINKDTYAETIKLKVNNNKQPRGTISIHKANAENATNALGNAEYGVYAKRDCKELLETLISDESGNATSDTAFLPGTYFIKEIKAPDGYTLDESIYSVIVDEDATTSTPVLQVADAPTKVIIAKVDDTGKALQGALLELRDMNGKVVESWTSKEIVHEISGKLIAGESYTLVEISAPDGYQLAKAITFKVALYGKEAKTISMVDAKVVLPIEPETDKPEKNEANKVETGDDDNMIVYMGLGCTSFVTLLSIGFIRKKKAEEKA